MCMCAMCGKEKEVCLCVRARACVCVKKSAVKKNKKYILYPFPLLFIFIFLCVVILLFELSHSKRYHTIVVIIIRILYAHTYICIFHLLREALALLVYLYFITMCIQYASWLLLSPATTDSTEDRYTHTRSQLHTHIFTIS